MPGACAIRYVEEGFDYFLLSSDLLNLFPGNICMKLFTRIRIV